MNIVFPLESEYDFDFGGVALPVSVDGVTHRVLVSTEVIQDHFGAKTADSQDMIEYTELNRERLQAIAESKIRNGHVGDVVIKNNDF